MPTGYRTCRNFRRRRVARARRLPPAGFAISLLALPALLLPIPARANAAIEVAICGGSGARTITLPTRESPSPGDDGQAACAHFTCPRERGHGDPGADEDG